MNALRHTSSQAAPRPLTAPATGTVLVENFEAVFLCFQGPITRFIYHRIGNREQAFDLAQDVFVKAYKALLGGTIVYQGTLSAWLYRIAMNVTTDTLRRRRLLSWLPLSLFPDDRGIGAGIPACRAVQHAGDEDSAGSATGDAAYTDHEWRGNAGERFEDRVADREILQRVFRQMPPKYAICLYLAEHEGLSGTEIAGALSISPSAVKMRLMRARDYFLALYRQETGEAGAA